MHRRNTSANFNILQMVWDGGMIVAAFFFTAQVYGLLQPGFNIFYHLWMLFLFILVFVLTMFVVRMYNITTFYYFDRVLVRTVGSALAAALALSIVIFMLQLKNTSRLFYLVFCVASAVFVALQRMVSRKLMKRYARHPARLAFIGDRETFDQFDHYLGQTAFSYRFVSCLSYDDEAVADTDAFERYIVSRQVDEVILIFSSRLPQPYKAYLSVCEDMGITARLVLDVASLPNSKRYVSSIGTYPVLTYHSVSMDRVQLFLKALFDVVGAAVGLVLASPVMALTALAIKLESPGPVLFKQKRAGLNGREFSIWKFRSMYLDAEERKAALMAQNKVNGSLMFKLDNDPRVTKVGAFIRKTSIDELPQLINVLRREMSLVGTRPPTLDEVKLYRRTHRRRISIRPGITGMWQVSGRSNIVDFEQVVELDNKYIDEWSMALDMKLLVKTFAVVFTRKGAC